MSQVEPGQLWAWNTRGKPWTVVLVLESSNNTNYRCLVVTTGANSLPWLGRTLVLSVGYSTAVWNKLLT